MCSLDDPTMRDLLIPAIETAPSAKRWFRKGQKWRTGCEGRVAKRRHGLDRCRYKGTAEMQRCVGLTVIANLIT
jgi:hypothetical protein